MELPSLPPSPPPALWYAMTRYVVASHVALLAGTTPRPADPVFAFSLMFAHRAASEAFFEAAAELSTPAECEAMDRFAALVDKNLGLRAP